MTAAGPVLKLLLLSIKKDVFVFEHKSAQAADKKVL
jgi:hypothetical protein